MIWTCYYAKYKGPSGVQVSNSSPDWFLVGETCKELYPEWKNVKAYRNGKMTWKEFRKAYIRKLKQLDVRKYWELLNGKVLLCYEKTGKHCHRHIIQEWFNRNGFACEELEASMESTTCAFCKYSDCMYSTHQFCRQTGEIMSTAQIHSRTCEDWRYRF